MKHEHTQVLQVAQASMPEEKQLLALAELFKACGDGTRIKILYALSASTLCVCAIGELLHMQQSAVSHQLAKLKAARLVVSRRVARAVRIRAARGELDMGQFPLLLHIDEILTENKEVQIPWENFTFRRDEIAN